MNIDEEELAKRLGAIASELSDLGSLMAKPQMKAKVAGIWSKVVDLKGDVQNRERPDLDGYSEKDWRQKK